MELDLSSVKAKLSRAIEHAKSVEDEIRSWGNTDPFFLTYEVNSDSTRYSVIHRFKPGAIAPEIERWSLIVADSVHNFRCALDHLVYAVAVAESREEPPPWADKLMFPICDDESGFNYEVEKRGRLGTISKPMRAVFELFQPYKRPYPRLPPVLSMLRDFENSDKHKLLRVLFTALSSGNVGFFGPSGGAQATLWAYKGEVKDGAEIAAFTFDRPTPNMKFDRVEFLLIFAMKHKEVTGGISDRDDATTLLRLIGEEVSTVIDSIAVNFK